MDVTLDLGGAEEAVLTHWIYDAGARIERGQVIAEAMIDKVTIEVTAPADGYLEILVPAGEAFRRGVAIARVMDQPSRTEAPSSDPESRPKMAESFIPMMPAVRRYALQRGVDLERLASFVGNGRRVTRGDVDAFLQQGPIPYTPYRQALIRHLTDPGALPTTLQRKIASGSGDMPLLARLAWALSKTLPQHPAIHGWAYGDGVEVARELRLGIAVRTPEGLLVAVVTGGDDGTSWVNALQDVKEKLRQGRYGDLDRRRPSFVLSNLGPWGVEYFTPRLMSPAIAILGVGEVQNGSLPVSLTFDHRAVDGVEAALFLGDLHTWMRELS
ncbi:2-oxo acid dehydrogenase subunit E2 [Sulfobacillus harzensis]|uniref:Dihydrolipoamide acetyltransferase component of pyruvate dehydrogenase complex n=1 Tax=Sulfobacillus harzensis TaxID=2729629 RepID=A0A7Y0L6K3_9FIRM|nr:2-oxo acid dehydrogenase subunit E2 [Sulfobacillus harzensis]NMP23872.1 dihydrolipoamide succinyltransferase [Sulfobacillus harzensis]